MAKIEDFAIAVIDADGEDLIQIDLVSEVFTTDNNKIKIMDKIKAAIDEQILAIEQEENELKNG